MPEFELQSTTPENPPPPPLKTKVDSDSINQPNREQCDDFIQNIVDAVKHNTLSDPAVRKTINATIERMDIHHYNQLLTALSSLDLGYYNVVLRALPQEFYNAVVHRALVETNTMLNQHGEKGIVMAKSLLQRVDLTIDPFDFINDVKYLNEEKEEELANLLTPEQSPSYKKLQALCQCFTALPDATKQFWHITKVNDDHLGEDDLFDLFSKLNTNPDFSPNLKEEIVRFIASYFNDDNEEVFEEEIVDAVDLVHPENFYKTARWVELLNTLTQQTDRHSFITRGRMKRYLECLACPKTDSVLYLLHQRIRSIVAQNHYHSGIDKEYTKEMLHATDEEIAILLLPENKQLENERPTIEMLMVRDKKNISQEQRVQDAQDIFYFEYLQTPAMQKIINNDFGVDLSKLSLPTQFRFLQFLKQKTNLDIEPVKQFTRDYGEEGLQAFLLLEDGQDYGDALITLGATKDSATIKNLFHAYAEFIEHIEQSAMKVLDAHKLIFPQTSIDFQQIVERLALRANQLLIESINNPHDDSTITTLTQRFQNEERAIQSLINEYTNAAGAVKKFVASLLNTDTMGQDFYQHIYEPQQLSTTSITSQRIKSAIMGLEADIYQVEHDRELWEAQDHEGGNKLYDQQLPQLKRFDIYIKILTKLLPYQERLEKTFDDLTNRRTSAVLPETLLRTITESDSRPENIPTQQPLYFPVGITSNMPEAMDPAKQMAKPIEAYSYLLWLGNRARERGEPAELVVCDEIQSSNYQRLYTISEDEARANAKTIGDHDRAWYENIIQKLGLQDVVRVTDYQTFTARSAQRYNDYKKITQQFASHPALREMFLEMVQTSIVKKSTANTTPATEDKEHYLAYGLEEIQMILATNGTKVSHVNEARYDVIAALIQNTELAWQQMNPNKAITTASADELAPFLKRTAELLREYLRDHAVRLKDSQKKESEQSYNYKYYATMVKLLDKPCDVLKKISAPEGLKLKKQQLRFSFVNPSVQSTSFGWDQRGQTRVGFIEPYTTSFVQPGEEAFLQSNQVIALPEGMIAGKILALEPERQLQYAEQSVKPLLREYFRALETMPKEYFFRLGKTPEQLQKELQESTTLIDILKFIQRVIINPTTSHNRSDPGRATLDANLSQAA